MTPYGSKMVKNCYTLLLQVFHVQRIKRETKGGINVYVNINLSYLFLLFVYLITPLCS